ncbi:hypothetical protein SARC_07996 [Sphaeroforma arctica JP610]|uniref:Uncharacterized protein n=1 Tax=Sphaeroforma arctica JP610 TaxID=667725 RepID=A0A0L0FSR3_9EUKA|nr:hypothetical protein SARC_07996 [Sphaeroforma arctica JP610]KNC79616.1 hypothetical protein SARC_07996 [Sphaeroforma arctica JP610]|eukprot:XP_014153518.1 hypothetical protein SARC_07996 [Sphaeroforma arctica JP610]
MEVLDTESPASPVQRRSNRFFIAPKDMDVRLVVGDAVKLTRPTVPTRPVDESRPPKAMRSSVTRPGSVPLSSAQDRNIHRQAEMRPTSGLLSSTLDKAVICGDEIRPKNGLLLSAAHPPASAPVPTGSGVRNRRALMVSSRTAYVDFVGSHETVL